MKVGILVANRPSVKIGDRFGRLLVVSLAKKASKGVSALWECVCDCGSNLIRGAECLIGGRKRKADQSCGCAAEYDLTGQKFGELTAIRKLRKELKGVIWEFSCSCGNIVEKIGSYIKRGQGAQHCGCIESRGGNKKNNLIGVRFGALTVTSFAGTNDKQQSKWACSCVCGNQIIVKGYYLRRGKKDCGCLTPKGFLSGTWTGYGELPRSYYTSLLRGARLRNLEFSVSIEFLWELFLKQDQKCALSEESICFKPRASKTLKKQQTASLDRINSQLGYTPENVQWVHKEVNIMKMGNSLNDFILWCKKVYEYSIKKEGCS